MMRACRFCSLAVLMALILLCAVPAVHAEDDGLQAALEQMDADALYELKDRIDDRLRALGVYPFEKLSEGSRGDEVAALQRRLAELGYYKGEADGRYRQTTATAMKAFEKLAGLRRDGIATVEDQKLLFSAKAPAQPTPTPSPTPKPTPTPNKARDYPDMDAKAYRSVGLMADKTAGSRYKLECTILALLDGGTRWLTETEVNGSAVLAAVEGFSDSRAVGDHVTVYGEYRGLTSYQSESGPVTLPLFKCEYLD